MASAMNGLPNGHASASPEPALGPRRFAHIKPVIEIPVTSGETEEAVDLDLEDLQPDPYELCIVLEEENVDKNYWTTVAMAYAKQGNIDTAIEIITKGVSVLRKGGSTDKLHLYNCLCWLHLLKSRQVPRVKTEGQEGSDGKLKDFHLRATTATLNEASRLNPAFPPLFLARGVLCLLRAALLQDQNERLDTLKQAVKAFDDALRHSNQKNMMALIGRSRAQFSLGKYAEALRGYQTVLQKAPDMSEPDPRIGIGCCFWQLGHKEDAKVAWQRALEIDPASKIANILTGLYYLDASSQYSTNDPRFGSLYKTAITNYTQQAFKLDNELPLACATFGHYFLVRRAMPKVEMLSRKAIELTDISAIASDGWYLLARKEHYAEDYAKSADYYNKADQARGGDERGYAPAKFGAAQLRVLHEDYDGAKFRLEKMVQQSRNVEAMSLLGALFAEDVFAGRAETAQEMANTTKKAIALLEAVRASWKDATKVSQTDTSVLLSLARLYETDYPDKALQCLQQLQQMELDELDDGEKFEDRDDEAARISALKEELSPQLLNNIGCFHYQAERYNEAQETFQIALKACVERGKREEEGLDTDALVTTVSFNLARTYEAEHMLDEAKQVYEGLLQRHNDYTDAHIRLTYIALLQSPHDEGPKAMMRLYEAESSNMEVRSLYGWFLRKAKRKTMNIAEDQEQRHFKHTLQGHDKHDRYALTGMGNLYLASAREMRRDTDQEKDRRKKQYERAVEFFDKAVQLDPRNAYAAQGIAIAMIEDRRDFSGALQVFSKVKDTVKDASVHTNLGHVYCEVKQYSRAIESYEAALTKDRARDPQILACLGRAWLLRGKQEKSSQAMKSSLEYSQRALAQSATQIHFRFNVAFVQIQIAQLLISLPEPQRTLSEITTAASDLDSAIDSFSAIAKSPHPPFPRHDIEQRANMGRNTMRKQLERAVQKQREYEETNKERLQKAREAREADVARRADERRKAEEAAAEQAAQVAEERCALQERDKQIAEERAERDEMEAGAAASRKEARKRSRKEDRDRSLTPRYDSDGNEIEAPKRKRTTKRKKKSEGFVVDSDVELDGADGEGEESGRRTGGNATATETDGPGRSDGERPRKKQKRRLERGTKASVKAKKGSKFKSDERIVDSDEDDVPVNADADADADAGTPAADGGASDEDAVMRDVEDGDDDDDAAAGVTPKASKRGKRVIDDDDEDDEDGGAAEPEPEPEAEDAQDAAPLQTNGAADGIAEDEDE